MNREEIIRMAREAGLDPDLWNYTDAFERFASLVAADEREACAKVCDGMDHNGVMIAADCAAAIRARSKQCG
jgi:hypothetical protein